MRTLDAISVGDIHTVGAGFTRSVRESGFSTCDGPKEGRNIGTSAIVPQRPVLGFTPAGITSFPPSRPLTSSLRVRFRRFAG